MNTHFFTSLFISHIIFLSYLPTTFSNLISFKSNSNLFSNQRNILKLMVYDYGFESTSFNITFLNFRNEETNFYKGKIAYINSNETFNSILKLSKLYNMRWYFYVDTFEYFDKVFKHDEKTDYYKFGIIIKEDIANELNTSITSSSYIPLLSISNQNHSAMINNDYQFQRFNTFYSFVPYQEMKQYPKKYFLTIAIIAIVLNCGYCSFWYIKYKIIDQNHIITLQRILIILPIMEFLIIVAIFLEVLVIGKSSNSSSSNQITYEVYIETMLITLNIVFRSLLWFLLVIVIYGWQITKQHLTREELKFFIKFFVFIYMFMCLDQIIDSIFISIFGLSASEFKNLIYYISIIYWLTQKGIKSYKCLRRKLIYANVVTREYIPSLILKLKMIKINILVLYVFLVLFMIILILGKTVFEVYDSAKFQLINYNFLDLLLMIVFMSIYFPRQLPSYFTADYGEIDENEDTGEIYVVSLGKVSEFNTKELAIKEKVLVECEANNYPMLIIHPFQITNVDTSTCINKIIETSNVGLVTNN